MKFNGDKWYIVNKFNEPDDEWESPSEYFDGEYVVGDVIATEMEKVKEAGLMATGTLVWYLLRRRE